MKNKEVAAVFQQYPDVYREPLLAIRELIVTTAEKICPTEQVVENLKWNQPSYTVKTGTPIRIDRFGEDRIAVFFNCQTTLIETFRGLFSGKLEFSKNRAIVLNPHEELPLKELEFCIQSALTYRIKT